MSDSTCARPNFTVLMAPTVAVVRVPVSDSVIPAAPGVMIRMAKLTLAPDGVSSQDTRTGTPLTFVVVVPDAMTVPPEFTRCISSVPAGLR